MKQLIVVRHAKSSWNEPALNDFDRPLNKRGKHEAPFMAKKLKDKIEQIDLIITSPALRAITTANIFAAEFEYEVENIIKQNLLYEADYSDIVKALHEIDDKIERVMLFGHNPGLTVFINYITGRQIDNLPTCGIAGIEFDFESWKELNPSTGKLFLFEYPKMYLTE